MSILECDHGSRVTHSPHTKPDHTVQAAEGPDEPERSRSRGWMSCSPVLAGTQGDGEGPGLHFAPAAHLAGHPWAAAGPAPSWPHSKHPETLPPASAPLSSREKPCRRETTWNGHGDKRLCSPLHHNVMKSQSLLRWKADVQPELDRHATALTGGTGSCVHFYCRILNS